MLWRKHGRLTHDVSTVPAEMHSCVGASCAYSIALTLFTPLLLALDPGKARVKDMHALTVSTHCDISTPRIAPLIHHYRTGLTHMPVEVRAQQPPRTLAPIHAQTA